MTARAKVTSGQNVHTMIARSALDAYEVATTHRERMEQLRVAEGLIKAEQRAVVADMRKAGKSWAEIGKLFGVTRQAAQQRWGGGSPQRR